MSDFILKSRIIESMVAPILSSWAEGRRPVQAVNDKMHQGIFELRRTLWQKSVSELIEQRDSFKKDLTRFLGSLSPS